MRHSHSFRAVLLSLALSVAAFADPSHPVGKPSGGGPVIEWQISITGQERIQLTVTSPDGETFSKEFTPGRNPMFRLGDLDSAPDGQYTFELRVVPRISSDVKKKLADAREAQDDALVRKIQRAAGIDRQLTESGGFMVLNGSIVSPDAIESDANDSTTTRAVATDAVVSGRPSFKTTTDDQVIPDDLIVQGSACVGLDCVANESFGFDTIRLKENNTRIGFDDTSTSAGFPANDWQLVANDNASGGQNSFAIFDQTAARNLFVTEAAAPLNSLYVDSTGNIGMQTAAPGLDLHMVETDTPAIRLEQTNGGGFTAQTWDVAGNEANFFVRDLTGGSRLPFRIRPGAPTSSIDINASGNVGVGTAAPQRKLHVLGPNGSVPTFPSGSGALDLLVLENNDNVNMTFIAGASKLSILRFQTDAAANTPGFVQYNHATSTLSLGAAALARVTVTATGLGIGNTSASQPLIVGVAGFGAGGNGAHVTAGGVWTNGSSRAFKNDVHELTAEEAKAAVAALQPVRYHYNAEPNEEYVGFIAEDVPELVAQTSTDRKYLSSMDIVATLTKVVQEQQKTIDELSKKVDELSHSHQ